MKILSLFTHVVPNLFDFLYSVEHKIIYFGYTLQYGGTNMH